MADADGRFSLQGLPAGRSKLRCRAPSWHHTGSVFQTYPCPSDDMRLVMQRTGIVKGKVVDEKGRPPTRPMILELLPPGEQLGKWGHSGQLTDDGSFEIRGIPPGDYIITARPNPGRADYQPRETKVTIVGDQTIEVSIVAAPGD